VTFNVYGDDQGQNESCPLSFPGVSVQEWARLEQGLKQRTLAINLFLASTTSRELSKTALSLRNLFTLPVGSSSLAWVCSHQVEFGAILQADLVRDRDGQWYVLEDNLRCPSGVSLRLREPAGNEKYPTGIWGYGNSTRR